VIKSKFDISGVLKVWIVVLAFTLSALLPIVNAVVHTYIIIPEATAMDFIARWDYDCPGWETKFVLYLKNPDDTWTQIQEFTSKCSDGETGTKSFEEAFTYDVISVGQNYTFGLSAKNADNESGKAEVTIYIPYPVPEVPQSFQVEVQ